MEKRKASEDDFKDFAAKLIQDAIHLSSLYFMY
jgi:hypothetical protein